MEEIINASLSVEEKKAIVILDCKVETISSNCTATPALHHLRQLQQVKAHTHKTLGNAATAAKLVSSLPQAKPSHQAGTGSLAPLG